MRAIPITLRPLLASFATLLVLATAGADASSRAIVTVAYDGVTQQVHPVWIQTVDGRQQPQPLRDTLWLEPGKHTLRLAARFDDNAVARRGRIDSRAPQHGVLEIQVEAGKRYLIGAKVDPRNAADWTPVVLRVEDVGAR